MKTLKATILLLATITFFIACDSDDNETVPRLNVQNLITTVNENLNSGETVGTVQAASSEGTISFSIENQSPANALSINPSTGELTVANASLWDFETNPIIVATISVLSTSDQQTAQVTINLEDMDDIAHLLSTSKTNYENATNGTWVQVTEEEYNILATQLNETNRSGISEANYQLDPDRTAVSRSFTLAAVVDQPETIPTNSYFFAVKYYADNVVDSPAIKVKISTTANDTGFSDLPELPVHSATNQTVAFVLKGVNTITSASNVGYLGFFKYNGVVLKSLITGGNPNYYFDNEDVNNFTQIPFDNVQVYYQGLSSTQKQWD